MFKTKLSILLLTSCFLLLSCTNDKNNQEIKYSLSYIGGGNDGLVLKNYLISHLKVSNLYDQNSRYILNAKINHNSNIYITNIDNTSDREEIATGLSLKIINKDNCIVYEYNETSSQFYLITSSEKFKSNIEAIKKIKFDNSENLVKQFINEIYGEALICN